jgi:hypothetical protein
MQEPLSLQVANLYLCRPSHTRGRLASSMPGLRLFSLRFQFIFDGAYALPYTIELSGLVIARVTKVCFCYLYDVILRLLIIRATVGIPILLYQGFRTCWCSYSYKNFDNLKQNYMEQ